MEETPESESWLVLATLPVPDKEDDEAYGLMRTFLMDSLSTSYPAFQFTMDRKGNMSVLPRDVRDTLQWDRFRTIAVFHELRRFFVNVLRLQPPDELPMAELTKDQVRQHLGETKKTMRESFSELLAVLSFENLGTSHEQWLWEQKQSLSRQAAGERADTEWRQLCEWFKEHWEKGVGDGGIRDRVLLCNTFQKWVDGKGKEKLKEKLLAAWQKNPEAVRRIMDEWSKGSDTKEEGGQ